MKKEKVILQDFYRYFMQASRTSDGRIKNSFRQKFTARTQGKMLLDIKKHIKDIEAISYGKPIFNIGNFWFSVGTKSPAFDFESLPSENAPRRLNVFFGFKYEDKKTNNIEKLRSFLGLDAKGSNVIPISKKNTSRKSATDRAKAKNKGIVWKQSNESSKKRLIKEEEAIDKMPYSFPLHHLILFIDQISKKHPSIAIALAKVYLTTTPGVNLSCEDAKKIAAISDKGRKKLTKTDILLLKKYLGPLMGFKTKTNKKFRDYQLVGMAFWRAAGGKAMIADQMGIGKTIQALGAMKLAMVDQKLPNPFPALIVCPRSVLSMWKREIKEWIPNTNPIILTGTELNKIPKKKNQIIITTYASMSIYAHKLIDQSFQMIILDESHNIKNPQANRTKIALEIGKHIPLKVELSGTPEEKELRELWTQMHFLRPDEFPSISSFVSSMETIGYDKKTKKLGSMLPNTTSIHGGKKVIAERYQISDYDRYVMEPNLDSSGKLGEPLRCHMIRRLKAQVLDLPPKTRQIINENLTKKGRTLYENMEMDAIKRLLGNRMIKWADAVADSTKESMDKGLSYAKSFKKAQAEHKELLEYAGKKNQQLALAIFQTLRLQSGVLKIPLVLKWVEEFYQVNPNESLLIFAEQHKVINELQKRLSQTKNRKGRKLRVETYTGLTSNKLRDKYVEDFQNGKIDVLILNKAGNEGITLTKASYVLFAERMWNPGQEEQAEDRVHRSGKKEPVTIYYFNIAPWMNGKAIINPIDNRMNTMIEEKRERVKSHIGNQSYKTSSAIQKSVTKEMIKDLTSRFEKTSNKSDNAERALKEAFKRKGVRYAKKANT